MASMMASLEMPSTTHVKQVSMCPCRTFVAGMAAVVVRLCHSCTPPTHSRFVVVDGRGCGYGGHTPPAASLSCDSSSTASSKSGSKMHVGGERCSLRRRSSSGHTAATYAGWRHSNWMPVLASKLRFTSTCVRRGPRLLWLQLCVARMLNAARLCAWAEHAWWCCINAQVVETRGRTGWAWISSSSRGTRCSGCCGQLASDGRADAMSWSSGCMSTCWY